MASTRVPITEGASGTYRWYVLGLLTLTSAFSVADRLVFGILVQDIKAEFSLSDFELGLLGGLAFSLVYVLAGFPAARLADRSTRKNIVACAIGFWSLMTAACGTATGFWTLFAARTGVGVGEGCSGPASQSLIADYFKQRRYAGSKDRRAVRELVYDAIRLCGPVPASGRAAMIALGLAILG